LKIFVANSGRCGSKFFAQMFNCLTDIPSFHEQIPYCIGQTSYELNNMIDPSDTTKRVVAEKIRRIKKDSSPEGHYFEASNMFIKSFIYPVMEEFNDVYCIYLHRNPFDTFVSHAERGWKLGYDWLLQPHWNFNQIRLAKGLSYYEVIMWNWFEVRERFVHWQHKFVDTYDFDFKDLNNLLKYEEMFTQFGIKHKKIDNIPDFSRNENKEGESVTKRYESIIEWVMPQWDVEGKEWAFPSDKETLDCEYMKKMVG